MAATKVTTCKLCYEPFSLKRVERIPRKLECSHTFCTECVQKLKNIQEYSIECPLCFMVTPAPLHGIDYLPKDDDILKQISVGKAYQKCRCCIKVTYPPKSATLHCADCNTVYCGSCSDNVHLKEKNQDHVIRLANSLDDIQLSRQTSARSNIPSSPVPLEQKPRSTPLNLVCSDHHQMLSLYCQKDKVRFCMQCRLSPRHQSHDCELVQTNNDQERNMLIDWQSKLEELIDSQSITRITVQRTIDNLKKNTKSTKENIRKTFWGFKAVLDDIEKEVTKEIDNLSQNKLTQLQNQSSSMIEIGNNAKTVSRLCEESIDLEFFEMLVQKKKLEKDVLKTMESLSQFHCPSESADLFVQFPNHESILSSIKSCPFIVRAPPAPISFQCVLTDDSEVKLNWCLPKIMKFLYPVSLYAVYASVGDNDSFQLLHKVNKTTLTLPILSEEFRGKYMVQFRVTCINIIGESEPCFPICIRLVKVRSQ